MIVKAAFAEHLTPWVRQHWEASVTKRQHYMQTPAGKKHLKKMAAGRRKANALRKRQARNHNLGATHEFEKEVSYAFGRVEKELEIISRSTRVPFDTLALGVAELLGSSQGR